MRIFLTTSILFLISCSHAIAQKWIWAKGAGGSNDSSWSATFNICTDNNGYIYATGNYNGNVWFGSKKISSGFYGNTDGDAFITKYDLNGNTKWVKSLDIPSTASWATGYSIKADNLGNVLMAGYFQDTIIIDNYTFMSKGSIDGVLIKYDSSGNVIWATCSINNTMGDTRYISTVTDKAGNIYVAGYFNGSIQIGSIKLSAPGTSALLIKYDKNGNAIWAKNIMAGGVAYSLAIDAYSELYLTWNFSSEDIFTAKYDTSGNNIWTKRSYSVDTNSGYVADPSSIGVDKKGNVYITGMSNLPSYEFGITNLYSTCIYGSLFMVKYDNNGNVVWTKNGNVSSTSLGAGGDMVTTDNNGNVYLSGNFTDTLYLSSDTLIGTTGGLNTTFILKFDSLGNTLCYNIIDNCDNFLGPITVDPLADNLYYGGFVNSSTAYCAFGNDTIFLNPPNTTSIAFLSKWTCDLTEGIPSLTDEHQIMVYPVPSNGIINFNTKNFNQEKDLEVYNVLGKKVCSSQLPSEINSFSVNLANEPNGIYLYRVISANGTQLRTGKLIIQK